MASGKGILINALGPLMLRDSFVTKIEAIGECFRRIVVAGPALKSVSWIPGDKVQVLLPSLDVRTYTPVRWDTTTGSTELLVFHHGNSPGADWSRVVKIDDSCRFVGPQRSIRAQDDQPIVLFGDETSFAVACALAQVNPARHVSCVFEVAAKAEMDDTLDQLNLRASTVQRSADDKHLSEIASLLRVALGRQPGAALVMTGRAQAIRALQSDLRATDAPRPKASKAYWALGKVGLD